MGEGEREAGRDRSRSVLVVALALAVAATVALVVTDSAMWLRFAVLAALWSALAGGGAAFGYRRRCREREDEMAELRARYESELEREITARREYELEVETEIRKEVEGANTEVLHNLRDEVRSLRANVDAMLGGEVLVERIALHAESTRMRQIPDSPHATVRQSPVRAQPSVAGDASAVRESPKAPWPRQDQAGQPTRTAAHAGDAGRKPPAPHATGPGASGPVTGTAQPGNVNGFAAAHGSPGSRHTRPERQAQQADGAGEAAVTGEGAGEVTGAHTAGTSVTELLAAHGGVTGGRRHRRRAE